MPELLEIEVDGQPLDEAPRPRGDAPSWGLPVAIAVAGVLAIAVLVVVVVPALTAERATTPAAPPPTAASAPATAPTAPPVDERLVGAEAALDAWGEFAVTGDLEVLAGSFDPAGPQYRDLAEEAPGIAGAPPGPPPYEIAIGEAKTEAVSPEEAVVTATVTWARPGEADQRYTWQIVLRRSADGRWLLWTIREGS